MERPEEIPVTRLKNVGAKRQALYQKIGIQTVGDLLRHYPRDYIDYTSAGPARNYLPGSQAIIQATVLRKLSPAIIRKGMVVYKAVLNDGLENLTLVIFNNEYAYYGLRAGEEYVFCGKLTRLGSMTQLTMTSFLPASEADVMRPVYSLTEGLAPGMVVNNMKEAVADYLSGMTDPMPEEVLDGFHLMPLTEAIQQIHFPENAALLEKARYRLSFEELFLLDTALMLLRARSRAATSARIYNADMTPFYQSLPFSPTNAQKRVIEEILSDLTAPCPMNRLLQGDVGSGKTMVAAAACYAMAGQGFQSTIMAPTEILASQHAKTLEKFLKPLGLRIGLLTGSMTPKQKELLRQEIAAGEIDLVAGTHALLQESTVFHRLGLVITDEQHRFGVEQRQQLGKKAENPHVLVMSATPIPRTLALIVYGDLDVSIIDELPAGRQPIETFSIHSDKRRRALGYIREHLDRGEQGYIICPLIEENADSEIQLMAAEQYAAALRQEMPGVTIGLLHGRMRPAEKDAVMAEFQSGALQLLVATTVVEVGVDVPNATIMMIENAERFGLSQLHQLRGRIGRGSRKSTCILVSDNDGEDNHRRLTVMKQSCDGFVIAKEDLKLRGAGDFFGSRQHGLPSLAMADLLEDTGLLAQVQRAVKDLLAVDPDLSEHPLLKQETDRLYHRSEGSFN